MSKSLLSSSAESGVLWTFTPIFRTMQQRRRVVFFALLSLLYIV